MPNLALTTVEGGSGGLPLGALQSFPNTMPIDFTHNGQRWLRTGFIETNTALFDNNYFRESRATLWTRVPFSDSSRRSVDIASNGANTIVNLVSGQGSVLNGTYRSLDGGVTWSGLNTFGPSSSTALSITFASTLNLWVSVVFDSTNTMSIFSSTNGISWTSRYTHGSSGTGWSIHWNGSMFVVAGVGGAIITSTNGTTWTPRTSGVSFSFASVTFGNGRWIAVANTQTNGVSRSTDGITWTAGTLGSTATDANLSNIIFTGSVFAFVSSTSGSTRGVYTSTDSITWTRISELTQALTNASNRPLAFGNGLYMHETGSFGAVAVSADGINWRLVSIGSTWPASSAVLPRFLGNRWAIHGVSSNSVCFLGNNTPYAGWPYETTTGNISSGNFKVDYMRIT